MSEKDSKKKPPEKVEAKPQETKAEGKSVGALGRIFNANTNAGRANVAKATYAGIFLAYLYFRSKKGKKPPPDEGKGSHGCNDGDSHGHHDGGSHGHHDGGSHGHHDGGSHGHHDGGSHGHHDGGSHGHHDGGSHGHHSEAHGHHSGSHGNHDGGSHGHHDGGLYDYHDGGSHAHHAGHHNKGTIPSPANIDDNKWTNRSNVTEQFIVPNYKTEIKFPKEMVDVPKSLPELNGSNADKSNEEEIRESAALNSLKRRISQNPRFMDP